MYSAKSRNLNPVKFFTDKRLPSDLLDYRGLTWLLLLRWYCWCCSSCSSVHITAADTADCQTPEFRWSTAVTVTCYMTPIKALLVCHPLIDMIDIIVSIVRLYFIVSMQYPVLSFSLHCPWLAASKVCSHYLSCFRSFPLLGTKRVFIVIYLCATQKSLWKWFLVTVSPLRLRLTLTAATVTAWPGPPPLNPTFPDSWSWDRLTGWAPVSLADWKWSDPGSLLSVSRSQCSPLIRLWSVAANICKIAATAPTYPNLSLAGQCIQDIN